MTAACPDRTDAGHHAASPAVVPRPLFGEPDARDALFREAEHYVFRAAETMRRTRLLLVGDRRRCLDLLSATRASLGRHFQRYQQFKHVRIFDPVVRHGRPSSKIVARTMKIDCLALGETFGGYHARWLGLCEADWPGYRRDTLDMIDEVSAHLDGELRAMRQLLMLSEFHG